MATFASTGTVAYGSTSVAPAYPASIVAGDLLLMFVATKPGTATIVEPSGWDRWEEQTGTFGTNGADTGPTKIAVFVKHATGSESGTQSVSITSGNSSWGVIYRITKSDPTAFFDILPFTGEDTTANTSFSAVCTQDWTPDVGPSITSGDLIIAAAVKPTDSNTWSAHNFSSTGVTFGTRTEIAEYSTTTGNDIGGVGWYATATAGTSSTNAITATATLSSGTNSYGPAMVIRVREQTRVTPGLRYRMNEGAGLIAYNSTDEGSHILVDPDAWWSSGSDTALQGHSASNEELMASDFALPNGRTVMFNWRLNSIPGSGESYTMLRNNDGSFWERMLVYGSSSTAEKRVEYYFTPDAGTTWFGVEAALPLVTNQWYHYSLVINPNGYTTLWHDGEYIDDANDGGAVKPLANVTLGAWAATEEVFDGQMRNLQVFDTALSYEQVKYWSTEEIPPASLLQPIAAYSFDEGSGSTANDATGNGHHIPIRTGGWDATGHTGAAIGGIAAGDADPVTIAAPITSSNVRTTTFWVRLDSLPTPGSSETFIFFGARQQSPAYDYVSFGIQGSHIFYYRDNEAVLRTWGDSAPTTTGWHHISLVEGEDGLHLYINGEWIGFYNGTDDLQAPLLVEGLFLGHEGEGAVLDGAIDDFRIFDDWMDNDIRAWMYTPVPYDSTPLVQQTFTTSGTFTVPSDVTSVDVLIVGGGGGGGRAGSSGGGGSGGQVRLETGVAATPSGTVSVTIGNGGAGRSATTGSGADGQASSFGILSAVGGGGGAGGGASTPGAGAYGGGGQGSSSGSRTGGTGTVAYSGGTGHNGNGSLTGSGSGGGGGAGGNGGNATGVTDVSVNGGNGGIGLDMSAEVGTTVGESGWFGGGGGGGTQNSPSVTGTAGTGGNGGGGDGTIDSSDSPGQNGLVNTGGGGGGGNGSVQGADPYTTDGGNGGSGVVIVKYYTNTTPPRFEGAIPGTTTVGLTDPTNRWIKPNLRAAWHNGTNWAAVLPTASGHQLYTNLTSPSPGTVVDNRNGARPTVVYYDGPTGHGNGWVGILRSHPTQSRFSAYYTSDYSAHITDSVVPLTPANTDESPISLLRSPNGNLWAAFMQSNNVQVSRSTDSGATWGSAQTVATISGASSTGIVGLTATGTTVVLVATGNDGIGRVARSISESAGSYASGSWTTETLPSLPSGATSDDHLSMTSTSDGRILAVSKVTNNDTDMLLIYLLVRSTGGTWTQQTVETGPDGLEESFTRPGITVSNDTAFVTYGGFNTDDLYQRTASLTDLSTWSSRSTLLTGPDYIDSAILPDGQLVQNTIGDFPLLAHNTTTQDIRLLWMEQALPLPITQYPFNEQSGTVVHDTSGNNNHGEMDLAYGAWAGAEGIVNVPEGGAFVTPAFANLSTTWTVMAEVRVANTTTSSGYRPLLTISEPSHPAGYAAFHVESNGTITAVVQNSSTWADVYRTTVGSIDTSKHHVAIVRSGTTFKFYIDGELAATASGAPSNANTESYFELALDYSEGALVYGDEMRVFNSALSEEQVAAYQSIPVPPFERTITYTDTPWNTIGTSTSGDGNTRYKEITIPGAQIGDLLLVFGVAENYQGTSSQRYMNDISAGGVKTGTWTYNAPSVNSDTDVDFYAGYALVTSSGDITIRVGLRINVSTGKVGAGAYLIPSTLLTSSYGFASSGFTNDTDSQIPTSLSSISKVIYMAGDWVTMGLGSTSTPAGGTVHRTFYDSSYGVWTALWDNQPVGTRNYGASGVSGHDISGAIFILGDVAAPTAGNWFLGTGAQLLPYTLTGSGLIALFDTLPPTEIDLPNIVGTASGGRQGGNGTFTVNPPVGSVGKIAIAQFGEASDTTITPPSGWSLVSSGNSSSNGSDNWSRYAIFIGGESATGTTWTLSNVGSTYAGCALVMSGYDAAIAINTYDLTSTEPNPGTLNSPSVSTGQTSLILRALTEQYDTAPTATVYPPDATLGRDRYYITGASGEAYGHHVAIAHSTQTEPGSTGTATWTMPNTSWHPSAITIAITRA